MGDVIRGLFLRELLVSALDVLFAALHRRFIAVQLLLEFGNFEGS